MTTPDTFDTAVVPGTLKTAMKGVQSSDLWMVPVDNIHVIDGFNVREKNDDYWASVREYADSMKANGFYRDKPLSCYIAKKDGIDAICVIDGHTRLDAVKLAISEGAAIENIPVVTKNRGTDMIDLTVSMGVSATSKPLKPYELAKVCKRLIGYGLDEAEIARRLSKGKPYIDDLLRLVEAPQKLQDMVKSGQVSATLAVSTIKEHGEQATDVLNTATVAATAAGKKKVTRQHVEATSEKPKRTPVVKNDESEAIRVQLLLNRGVEFIINNFKSGGDSEEGALKLLTNLTGLSREYVASQLAEKVPNRVAPSVATGDKSHLQGHTCLADMVAPHIAVWRRALNDQIMIEDDAGEDTSHLKHEQKALNDIEFACDIEIEGAKK